VLAGPILVIVALVLVGPIAVMLAGAIWSAIVGWLLVDDAETRAEGQPT
jgi:hypothetical protein